MGVASRTRTRTWSRWSRACRSSSSRRSSATPRMTSPRTRTFWRCRSASRRWATKFSYIVKTGRRHSRRGDSRVFRTEREATPRLACPCRDCRRPRIVVKIHRGLCDQAFTLLRIPLTRGAWIPGDPRVRTLDLRAAAQRLFRQPTQTVPSIFFQGWCAWLYGLDVYTYTVLALRVLP